MAGPSGSTSATFNSTSSQAFPAKGPTPTPTSTSKTLATTDTAPADQDPTPSPTSGGASTATSPTSSGGGDVTTTTVSNAESHPTSTGTQIAIPSHKTDSGSAAPTASSVQGVSSSSFSPSVSQDHTQSSSDVSIPLPLPPTPTSVAPSLTAVSTASLPSTTVSVLSTRINALPAPPSIVPSSSQPILTPHIQGTVGSGGSGASISPVASRPSSIASSAPSDDGSEASAIAQASSRSPVTTSTITDKPETTLSTPVFLTVTDAQNHTTISEPPVFTSVEVTTSNGEQVSVTHVIANPTGIWGVNEATSSHGFFSNSGAVAGVFLVVGLIIASIIAGIFLYFRCRRRRAPIFMESISRPLPMPDDPFEDPRTLLPPSEMTYASGYADRTPVIAGAATPHPTPSRSPFDSDLDHGSPRSSEARLSSEHLHGLELAGVGAGGRYGDSSQSSLHSQSRQPSQRGPVGLAITTDISHDSASSVRREPSSAQSSPSIYPPSLPTLSGEDNHSLVDVSLGNDGGATRFTSTSTTRLSSPTTRKPVPPHDFLEPVAPVPRLPQQQQAEQTSPPVIPPRSPLRRNSVATSRSRSPPLQLASIRTQLKNPELADAALQPYEPLTPPTSLASLSPAGSSSGHEALTPISPADAIPAANPFSDAHAQIPHGEIITAFPMTRSGNKRDTFYTRTRGSQRRPSVEWRQRD